MNDTLIIILIFAVVLAFYIGFCYLLGLICEKAGVAPGILIYIPIIQILPLFEAADLSLLWIIALFIPFVNIVVSIFLWWKICENIGKSPLFAILMLVPFVGILVIPYLALSD